MMVLFALAFVALCAGVGMSADMGMYIVEQQHLQTAVDSAAVAGARYLVAYSGDPSALSQAQTAAQQYLTQYGYPASAFTGTGNSLTMTSPATRQFRIVAQRSRPTMLIKLVGISSLTASASTTANAELKADIYAVNDVTGSMSSTDMTNLKNALNSFIDMLGLDPTDSQGPQIAVGQFRGERCQRKSTDMSQWARSLNPQDNPLTSSKWVAYTHWVSTTGGWCDNTNPPPLTAYTASAQDPPASGLSGDWNPYYPGGKTTQVLTQSASNAHTAVNALDQNAGTSGCVTPSAPPPATDPYGGVCALNGTSHTAGLETAWQELGLSNRTRFSQGQQTFRRVLILETDGTVCRYETPFSKAQSEARARALATNMKNNPTSFLGVEIFVIMFWETSASQSCYDMNTDDSVGTAYPNCPAATSLANTGTRTPIDDYLISISSSTPNTCDHYFPWNKTNGANLANAYREILKRIAVGKILN
ncbi:MAG TPA: pilus assembly protein TadG-related protein [Chloroflexota bacterium]|nr:pilus assembly protein TadG-related protein [Chloroflexota bacterium]